MHIAIMSIIGFVIGYNLDIAVYYLMDNYINSLFIACLIVSAPVIFILKVTNKLLSKYV